MEDMHSGKKKKNVEDKANKISNYKNLKEKKKYSTTNYFTTFFSLW